MSEGKTYLIQISRKDGDELFDLANTAIVELKRRGRPVPEKFSQASLGLCCRFQLGRRPVYKLTEKHLMGVLDTIGGYFVAAHIAVETHGEPRRIMTGAKRLMKLAMRIEQQAIKQGFEPSPYRQTPSPGDGSGKRSFKLIKGGRE